MVICDDRIGSKHYAAILGPARSTIARLEYGDACFTTANGVSVGVEVKTIGDAISCMFTGRLADHQIPGLRNSYDYVYLVVEGMWRPGREGLLETFRWFDTDKNVKCGRWNEAVAGSQRLLYSAFESWLTTLEMEGGLRIRTTSSPNATAELLWQLYGWWQKSHHTSFRQMHEPSRLSRPTMIRRILALLPGVGWDRSAIYAQKFKSVRQMVDASLDDWYIEGQIAEHSALKIVKALNGD